MADNPEIVWEDVPARSSHTAVLASFEERPNTTARILLTTSKKRASNVATGIREAGKRRVQRGEGPKGKWRLFQRTLHADDLSEDDRKNLQIDSDDTLVYGVWARFEPEQE